MERRGAGEGTGDSDGEGQTQARGVGYQFVKSAFNRIRKNQSEKIVPISTNYAKIRSDLPIFPMFSK